MVYEENVQYDVKVANAYKSYGSNNVLNGLNMNVKSGSIYGLLGSSGCGKSTLLQCILGTLSLDTGFTDLKAKSLRDIGYMPQDLCLDYTLTIRELFEYFGTLYNMSKKNIESRVDELTNFLQLPKLNNYIKNLSGGQSRRVSLAICLLHNPKIIILDEPTVGMDPLLRKRIWDEFKKMVEKHKKTIIITTHYIEEANEANCVGLMRKGVLIEEGSPRDILSKYDVDTLEAVFLKLCYNQQEIQTIQYVVPVNEVEGRTQSKNLTDSGKRIDSNRIKALVKKNIHVMCRDYFLMFVMFVIPIVQTYFLCIGIGVNFEGLSIAIKNNEINSSDCTYSKFDGCIFDKENTLTMSCFVINQLALLKYKLVEVKDRDAGEKVLKNSNYIGFIHFPKNYTRDLTIFVDDRENYAIQSKLYMHFAKYNFLFKNQLASDMTMLINDLFEKILNGCSNNPKSLRYPLEINILIGKDVQEYNDCIIAILVMVAAFYYQSVFSLSLMLSERLDGTLSRSMFAGVKVIELLIALFCISNILIVVQLVIPIFMAYVLFSSPIIITSGLFAYAIMMILTGWTGFFVGLIVAGLFAKQFSAICFINELFMTQFLLSGIIWPLEAQHPLLLALSQFIPTNISGKTATDISLKGLTLSDPLVIMGVTKMVICSILLLLVLIILGKIRKNMWIMHKS